MIFPRKVLPIPWSLGAAGTQKVRQWILSSYRRCIHILVNAGIKAWE
jgi:hypothetical protein